MSGKHIHEWNVIVVNEHGFPRKPQEEFQVTSKSLLGASVKAKNKIKKDLPDWKINAIWWMDPNRVKKERYR
tara:strand:- start:3524 stop:3739 length:216 start_codon:yes stop_codon:yes gene_type:complete